MGSVRGDNGPLRSLRCHSCLPLAVPGGGVDDIAHVRFVNAHAKCHCRHDNIRFFTGERILVLLSYLIRHTSMIWGHAVALSCQSAGHGIDIGAPDAVNDPGLVGYSAAIIGAKL